MFVCCKMILQEPLCNIRKPSNVNEGKIIEINESEIYIYEIFNFLSVQSGEILCFFFF